MTTTNITSDFIESIYKSRKTLITYLSHPVNGGHNCDDYDEFSVSEVSAMVMNTSLDLYLESSHRKAYVKYYIDNTIRPNVIYDLIEELYHTECLLEKEDDLILVIKDEPNDTLVKTLKSIWDQDGIYIAVFSIKQLLFNVLEHTYVPEHIRLTDDEKTDVYEEYNISNDSQIPEISRFDPVACAIFLRPSQVCKIKRFNKSSFIQLYYRICCS